MSNFVTVGKRLIPPEQIALVEAYKPGANASIQSARDFLARVIMVNRDSVLIEESPQAFAESHGFRMLPDDGVAANPTVNFTVETFEPTEDFTPTKPYASRLRWRDLDGNEQSKLLLTQPEDVLAHLANSEAKPEPGQQATPRRKGFLNRLKPRALPAEPAPEVS